MGFGCFVRSLTTSWVCVSQSAKSIRSKRERERKKKKTKVLRLVDFLVAIATCKGTHCGFLLSSVFLEACSPRMIVLAELLCSEVTPRGKHPVEPRRRGGIFIRFSLPMLPTLKQKSRRRLLPKF